MHGDFKGLWCAVLLRTIRDAQGEALGSMTSPQRRKTIKEAAEWLTKPEFEEQRVTVCEAAGVDLNTLTRYVYENGLHKGLGLAEVRACAPKPLPPQPEPGSDTRRCEHCGTLFPATRSDKRYCSQGCKSTANARKRRAALKAGAPALDEADLLRACAECGEHFAKNPARKSQKYCSTDCYRVAAKKRSWAKAKAERRAQRSLICTECGGALPEDAHGCQTLCSDACRKAVKNRKRREASRERSGATS